MFLRAPHVLLLCAAIMSVLQAWCAMPGDEPANGSAQRRSALELYTKLQSTPLDVSQTYQVRDIWIEREDIHLTLRDGRIAFTQEVDGRITGAFFEGEGEVLISPPDRVERWSMGVGTGSAILEEQFTTAYFRFNDDTFTDLEPGLRVMEPPDAQAFLDQNDTVARELANSTALRLLESFLDSERVAPDGAVEFARDPRDRLFYARLLGQHLGLFDITFDTLNAEQITVMQFTHGEFGTMWANTWASFPMRSARRAAAGGKRSGYSRGGTTETMDAITNFPPDPIAISRYKMHVRLTPPAELAADADMDLQVSEPGHRVVLLELSRYLKVSEAAADGAPLEFIQNTALQGTDLERRGNDTLAIVFPEALVVGRTYKLHMHYSGPVMTEAGNGLMYVGARGIWYPNRGVALSDFDLEFEYPSGWTLLATGKRAPAETPAAPGERVDRFVSERPIPLAGFNLGQYMETKASTANVQVDTYAARGVEASLAKQSVVVLPGIRRPGGEPTVAVIGPTFNPVEQAQKISDQSARIIEYYSARVGPYPYSSLALTQMPGPVSQGWPGLIFLSSYSFLTSQQRAGLGVDQANNLLFGALTEPHEIAHEWFGDLVLWKSYREQWLVEALSNYCALLMIQSENPEAFDTLMERYRQDLLSRNKDGIEVADAGPVTLGIRLNSSRFPNGYVQISYGRGTWLMHMLRHMILDATSPGTPPHAAAGPDDPFFRVLRKLRERFEGKVISTRDLEDAFAEELPKSLWFENKKSLDWFFDGWVNGTSIPRLEAQDVKLSHSVKGMIATGKIIQQQAAEGLVTSVPVYALVNNDNVYLGRVFADGPETSFRLEAPAGTRKILLDPYHYVLTRH
jgi:hypothetical protein